jgi:hypothetical protein
MVGNIVSAPVEQVMIITHTLRNLRRGGRRVSLSLAGLREEGKLEKPEEERRVSLSLVGLREEGKAEKPEEGGGSPSL